MGKNLGIGNGVCKSLGSCSKDSFCISTFPVIMESQHIAYEFCLSWSHISRRYSTTHTTSFLLYLVSKKTFPMNLFLAFPFPSKEKPGMPIIFLTQIQLLLIFFVRSQPNYLKLFCAQKKDLVKYSILMIVFVILKVETNGPN